MDSKANGCHAAFAQIAQAPAAQTFDSASPLRPVNTSEWLRKGGQRCRKCGAMNLDLVSRVGHVGFGTAHNIGHAHLCIIHD